MTTAPSPSRQHPPAGRCLALAVGLLLMPGCYTGLDDEPPPADPSADDGPARDPGGGGDDDGTTPEPDDSDPGPPFRVPTDEARLLPFPVRMQNLAHVTGQDLEHPMFLELYDLRYQLGDHDFASGVAADPRWSADKMQAWVRGLTPVCESTVMREAYPDLLTDPRPMMRAAWGREPTAEEAEVLIGLGADDLDEARRFPVACIAILTALDFVAV